LREFIHVKIWHFTCNCKRCKIWSHNA